MKLIIAKSFDFAHRGCDVVRYEQGQDVQTDDLEMIEVALAEGWAKKAKAEPQNKAQASAPENKSSAA